MKKILIIVYLLWTSLALAEQRVEELEQFEIRSYNPQVTGVKDLVFEIRIDGLADLLSKNLVIGKIIDLYFKIYWQSPSQYRIEVEGLKPGFKEVKDDLKQLIKGKLDFVIPEKFSERLKPYSLKVEPITNGKLLKAIDESYSLAVPEIDIIFDSSGKLKTMDTKAPNSMVRTEFFHSPKSWSNNKLVLDKVVSTSGITGSKVTVINDLEYANINGIGLPAKLVVKNVVEYMTPPTEKEKSKLQKKETTTTIRFSKYEVNTGKAIRYINEGILR